MKAPFHGLLPTIVLALSGCGGVGEISGVVKYQGKVVPAGTISFYDEGRGVWSSDIKPDGSYAVSGVPTGTARITVLPPPGITMAGMPPPPKSLPIPPKYGDPNTSGLTYKVKHGSQTHDVQLE